MQLPNSQGTSVPLSSLGHFEYRPGLGTIHRINQKRVVTVSGSNARWRLADEVLKDVQRRLEQLGRPTLATDAVRDWPALAVRLKDATDGILGRAVSRLSGDARDALDDLAGATADEAGKAMLIGELNEMLRSRDFYQKSDVPEQGLPRALADLREEPLEALDGEDLAHLNRHALNRALGDILAEPRPLQLPDDYSIRYAGEKEEQEEAQAFLMRAFAVALLLIVGILVTQFNTLSAPLIIMTTIVLSTIGVFTGLVVIDQPFDIIMTGVGVISLAGVVVNNAIVLLDYTRQLQRKGMELMEAAVEAGVTRLRPVLLTASTTILGLIPMLTGISFDFRSLEWATRSESSQWWRSMAAAVVFGLAFATPLTLFVVPTLYVSLYRLARKLGLGGLKRAELSGAEQVRLEDY
jgi:multidrug efflux pump subunit AcrB